MLLTGTEDVDRIDPRRLLIFLIILDQNMQAPDILEPHKSQLDLSTFDILLFKLNLLSRCQSLRIPKIDTQVIDEQFDIFRRLRRTHSTEDRYRFQLDGFEEWNRD